MGEESSWKKPKTLLEYKWIVTKEVDRINRQSQRFTSLHARINKLLGLAQPLLWQKDPALSRRIGRRIEVLLRREGYGVSASRFAPVLVLDEEAVEWWEGWDRISNGVGYEPQSPTEVRWKQFGHLMRLFHARGAFIEEEVPVERISAFEEFGVDGVGGKVSPRAIT